MKKDQRNGFRIIDVHDVRDINQTVLLHLIRERQPISRADITKYTGLRAGTVSAIVNRLIKNDLVYEGREGPSSGGRRPTNLYINAESYYVLAIDIGVLDTLTAVADFNGRIIHSHSIPTTGDPKKFLKKIADKANKLIKEEFSRVRFAGAGVSVPGLIDRKTGSIEISPNLEWQNVPLQKMLEKELGLPVFVENDANAAAFSELWYGPISESKLRTLLFILVVEGLGTGLIINGALHTGSNLGMGGFGHMSIDPNGELCSCGRRGCWETFASERATVERYHRVTAKQGLPMVGLTEIISLANKGDERALDSLKLTAEYLGEGISNLVHGIFPEAVVIGGDITGAWTIMEPIIRKRLHSKYVINSDKIVVRPASVRRPSLFGAIPIALQNFFRSPDGKSAVQAGKG